MNYSHLSAPEHDDKQPTPDDEPSELRKAQELLILLGDPRQRVSVPPQPDGLSAEPATEPAIEPPIGRRYQVG